MFQISTNCGCKTAFIRIVCNWINANEGVVSTLLAVLTIAATVLIPLRIANKQNKIALYEKRFECYQQFKALEAFWLYLNEVSTFNSSPEQQINHIWICQQRYFSAHALLEDKNFQKDCFNSLRQIIYARFCLEEDRKMLLSLSLLVKNNNRHQFNQTQDALEIFILALFNERKKFSQDQESATESFYKELLQKKNAFVSEFAKMLQFESELEKLLKIEKGRMAKNAN